MFNKAVQYACPNFRTRSPLETVSDETFSTGVPGSGFAVEPAEGKVCAPFDGACENLTDTLHALGCYETARKHGKEAIIMEPVKGGGADSEEDLPGGASPRSPTRSRRR